jgi:DNA repair protein RadC
MVARSRGTSTVPLRSGRDIVQLATAVLGGSCRSRAAVVVIGLDATNRVAGVVENRRRWSLRAFGARELVALARELRAHALVLVQFVPNKRGEPSMADAHDFRSLASRCAADRTLLLDCIVVSGEHRWSLAGMARHVARSN